MTVVDERAARGRPRDPAIEPAVLDAARSLLEEDGFAATTVTAIARRSGVHPPAIYRRWPSRLALVEDAALSGLAEVDVVPAGDLRADLRRFLQAYEASLCSPVARAAMPGLMAAYQGEPPSAARWLRLSVRPQFVALLEAAGDAVRRGVDPDEAFDLVLGAVLARALVPTVAERPRWLDSTVDLIASAIERRST